MEEQHGINCNSTSTLANCCSLGLLNYISGSGTSQCGLISGNTSTFSNCFYLNGIKGNTKLKPYSTEKVFYKTLEGLELPENEEDYPITTAQVVVALNDYIAHPDDGIDTKGWCKWVESEDHLPILDFDYEWDPTAGEDGTGAFVKVN